MSIRQTSTSALVQQPTAARASTAATNTIWTRPVQWLALPDITGLQRFVGLYAIYPDGNLLALSAAGNYTVDWGDGTTTNHNSGTVAYKSYTYSSIASDNESVLGYRQVIVQVYPQSGQNLTTINLQQRHNQSGLNTTYSIPWLEIAINGSNLTTMTIGGTITLGSLRQATIFSHAATSLSSLFQNCRSLVSVPLFSTANVTTVFRMFTNCQSLRRVPLFNLSGCTTASEMLNGCVSLESVPPFNTAACTSLSAFLQGCAALSTIPLLNTAAATNVSSMFQNCSSLQTIPLINTAAATTTQNMFSGCTNLQFVPLLNTATATNVQGMFGSCNMLGSVPALNLSAVTSGNFSGAFSCPSLASCAATGINQTVSFASCKLSAAEINKIFTNLSSSGSGKTVTVTGNYGAATCDQTIATAKGWTVAV